MSDELIRKKLAAIIYEGDSIIDKLSTTYSNREYPRDSIRFHAAAKNLLLIRFGKNSHYYADYMKAQTEPQKYEQQYEYQRRYMQRKVGVLEAVLNALESGLTDDLFYQRELLVFSNLLEQAYEFYENRLFLAAGTYGRVVLETTIKEFAKEKGIDSDRNFDSVIVDLRKENIINHPFEHSLRANYKIGSLAAHGNDEFNDLSDREILEFLNFIRDKVLTLS